MEEATTQAPSKRRCSVYEVDGFRFRRKKRTTETSVVDATQEEIPSCNKTGPSKAATNSQEKDTSEETVILPHESTENTCAIEQVKTTRLHCQHISKDQPEEERLKSLCEAIWTGIYKEAIDEKLPEKGTLLRVLEDVRVAFLDELAWYLDNAQQRTKTVSELCRPNPMNVELEARVKSLERDLNCYCNELLDWSNAACILEQSVLKDTSNDSPFTIEERAKKIATCLSTPYEPQLAKQVEKSIIALDIHFTELLGICRTIMTSKNQTAETIQNLNKWIYHCSFAGLPELGNPKKLLKAISSQ